MSWLLADDPRLFFSSLNFENNSARRSACNIAYGMLINAKSKCLIFNFEVNVFLGQDPMDNVSFHKGLGLTFTTNLKWEVDTASNLSSASKAFYYLKHTVPWNIPSKVKLSLYNSSVFSILLSGCRIFLANEKVLKKMELFQKKQ